MTYESLAEASGMSKSGLIYHFPSRQDLMLGVHGYMAEEWERELVDAAGGRADEVDAATRLRAIVITMSRSATRAELVMQLDAMTHQEFNVPWQDVDRRWMPSAEGIVGDGEDGVDGEDAAVARAAYLVQIAADGMWLHDKVHEGALTPAQRTALTDAILAMIPEGPVR